MTPAALPPAERVVALDVVRGFALLGILVMNLPAYTAAGDPSPVQQPVDFTAALLRDLVLAGKFNSIFSLLFGLGFSLQLARLEARAPQQARSIYERRLMVLLAIGLAHGLVFFRGDVLHVYAVLGFVLLWLRRWRTGWLVALMALLVLAPALVQAARWLVVHQEVGALVQHLAAEPPRVWSPQEITVYEHGSFMDVAAANVAAFLRQYTDPTLLRAQLGYVAQVLTTMVLGLLIGRHGWLQQIPQRMRELGQIQVACLVVGVVSTAITYLWHQDALKTGAPALKALVGTCYGLGRLGLMGFYVLSLVRLLQHPWWQARLAPLAAAGRMPMTTYLLQTILCSGLFFGWGLGLWNRVDRIDELVIAAALFFVVQLPLSVWWLGRFGQGPFEWLWRRATYGRSGPVS